MTAEDVVRDPRLWAELAGVMQQQAALTLQISEAIAANDFDSVRVSLEKIVSLVQQRQPTLARLAPAIQELMAELFSEDSAEENE